MNRICMPRSPCTASYVNITVRSVQIMAKQIVAYFAPEQLAPLGHASQGSPGLIVGDLPQP